MRYFEATGLRFVVFSVWEREKCCFVGVNSVNLKCARRRKGRESHGGKKEDTFSPWISFAKEFNNSRVASGYVDQFPQRRGCTQRFNTHAGLCSRFTVDIMAGETQKIRTIHSHNYATVLLVPRPSDSSLMKDNHV